MAKKSKLEPFADEIAAMFIRGMSSAQIAKAIWLESKVRVTRQAVHAFINGGSGGN